MSQDFGVNADTVFDKILRQEIPAQVVFENDAVLAFRDIQPQAEIHVVVIPKQKIVRFSQLKDQQIEWVGAFFQAVAEVAKSLGLEADGYRVVVNNGPHGGQTVDYLHAHILGGEPLRHGFG